MNGRDYVATVKEMPCACCGKAGPSSAHHLRSSTGAGMRASDWLVIPLCWDCHQGPHGVHGDRAALALRKKDQHSMLAGTIATAMNMASAGPVATASESAAPGGGTAITYLGEAWLRAAKHDWVRFTLHPENLGSGNPFQRSDAAPRYMLAVVPINVDGS